MQWIIISGLTRYKKGNKKCVNKKSSQVKKILFFLTALIIIHGNGLKAQKAISEEPVSLVFINGHFGGHLPSGDMKDRFGNCASVGGTVWYKTKNNWILGAEGNYIFGNDVKETNLFANLLTENETIIDAEGIVAEIGVFERGFTGHFQFGKLIPVWGPNPNSGILITAGLGMMQHKIRIETPQNEVPALQGDYIHGYDRLSSGFSTSQFLGYMYLSNRGRVNFYAGFEFIEGWTQNRRKYNFDQMGYDNTKRFDMLSGVKVGWIFIINKGRKEKHYYF